MRKLLNRHVFACIVIVLVSLLPLFWYGNNSIILGHDTGWTLNPIDRFTDRLSSWTHTGFGYDQALEMGTVTIYALPAFLSYIGVGMINVQKLTYIFWFLAMGFAAYFCVISFFNKRYSYLIALGAAVFLLVNHYVLQAWTVAELSKFSIIALFLVGLGCLWRILEHKKSIIRYEIVFGLASFLFNGGGGSGIPLYAGMFLVYGIFFFYEWLVRRRSIVRILATYLFFGLVYVLINLYWLIPLQSVISSQYSPFSSSGGPGAAVAWTNVISANTSYLNLFRLQGFSGWYDEPTHPYAFAFLTNPYLILLSILFPIIALLASIVSRDVSDKKVIALFLLILVGSVLFTAGTHEPLGGIYSLLMTKVFGFAIFRTAFYKFGYALWFAYGVLVSYSLVTLFSRLHKKGAYIGLGVLLILVGIYNYPYFTGQFFNINKDFTTRISIPSYIPTSVEYLNSLPQNARILLLPPPSPVNGQTDIYKFGYFSRTPLPFQVTQKSIVSNLEINTPGQEELTERFYNAFDRGEEQEAKRLLQEMGVTHLLLRGDVQDKNATYPIVSPERYKTKLKGYSWIKKDRQMGEWELYSITNSSPTVSVFQPNFAFINGDTNTFTKNRQLQHGIVYVPSEAKSFISDGQEIITAKCSVCEVSGIKKLPGINDLKIYPTSPFYLISSRNEKKNLENSKNDSWIHFGYLYFYAEKHSFEIFRIAEPYIENPNVRIDQEQRFRIVETYKKNLAESLSSYHKLSDTQKLSVVNEYITSLEKQRQRLKSISKSKFFNEIFPIYNETYALIDNMLEDKAVLSALEFKNKYYTFELTVPRDDSYTVFSTKPTQEFRIDNTPIPFSNTINLREGNHRIDLLKDEKPILQEETIQLVDMNPVYEMRLSDLLPNTEYLISFDYFIKGSPGVKLTVQDALRTNKLNALLEQRSSFPIKNYQASFVTGNASQYYTLRLYAEKDFADNRDALITNLTIKDNSQPELILEGKTKNKTTSLPQITSEYINPTLIKVRVKNAKDPYVLVYKESFSPLWEASIDGQKLPKKVQANFAFNGWLIDKSGDYEINISYLPEWKYKLAQIVSIVVVTLLVALYVLGFAKIKRWKR